MVERELDGQRAHMSHVFSHWLKESLAKRGCLLLRWGVLTVSLSVDSETPLLRIIVPQKIESNIKDAKEPETHVIKKLGFGEMTGIN